MTRIFIYVQAPLVNYYYYSLIVIKLEQLLSFVIILFISRIPLHYSFIYLFLMKKIEEEKNTVLIFTLLTNTRQATYLTYRYFH